MNGGSMQTRLGDACAQDRKTSLAVSAQVVAPPTPMQTHSSPERKFDEIRSRQLSARSSGAVWARCAVRAPTVAESPAERVSHLAGSPCRPTVFGSHTRLRPGESCQRWPRSCSARFGRGKEPDCSPPFHGSCRTASSSLRLPQTCPASCTHASKIRQEHVCAGCMICVPCQSAYLRNPQQIFPHFASYLRGHTLKSSRLRLLRHHM